MICIKCGKNIPGNSLFCNFCGAKQESRCASCGAVLPAGSRFCNLCGEPVGGKAEKQKKSSAAKPAASVEEIPEGARCGADGRIYGCSEKQGEMVYVPGEGLYYLLDNNLYLLPEGEKKRRKLTRYAEDEVSCYGLNRYNDSLYFFRRVYSEEKSTYGRQLIRYDLTDGKKTVFLKDLPRGNYQSNLSRVVVQDGVLYYIAEENKEDYLAVVNLDSGNFVMRKLPVLRWRDVCNEWKTESNTYTGEYIAKHEDERLCFSGLYLHDGYGYAVVCGFACFNIRFDLSDPSDFTYLPFNSCSAYKAEAGMISVCGDVLVGVGAYEAVFATTTGVLSGSKPCTTKQLKLREYADRIAGTNFRGDGNDWWRVGNRYFFNRLMVDMDTMKFRKLPFAMDARDFHELPDGSVLIRGSHHSFAYEEGIYHLPANCWDKIDSQAALEKYLVLEFD